MNKIKTTLLALITITTLAGCGGGGVSEGISSEEPSISVEDLPNEEIVRLAINNDAIMNMNSYPVSVPTGKEIKLNGDDNDFVVLTTSFLVEGEYKVSISWTPNMRNAFTFEKLESGHYEAHPNYPEVGYPDRNYKLTAVAKYNGVSSEPREYLFRVIAPTKVANQIPLLEAQSATSGEMIWVQGEVTRILLKDYNSAFIQDENGVGFALYHIDFSSDGKVVLPNGEKRLLQVGDYIKAIGTKGAYEGLQQIGDVTLLEIAEKPEGFPKKPIVTTLTEDFFKSKNPLLPGFEEDDYTGQASLVKVEGLKFDHFEDRKGDVTDNDGALSVIDTKNHLSAIALLGETKVTISFNYHIGAKLQTEFINFLINLKAGETFNYEGVLGMYSGLNLQPMASGDLYK